MESTLNIYCSLLSEACEYTDNLEVLDESIKDLGKKVWGAIKTALKWIKEKFIALGRRIKALIAKIFHKNKEAKEPEKVEPFVEMKDINFAEDEKFHADDINVIESEVNELKRLILDYSKEVHRSYVKENDNDEGYSDSDLLQVYDNMKEKNDKLFKVMDAKITLSQLKKIQPICDRCAATIDTSIDICDKSIIRQTDVRVMMTSSGVKTLGWSRISSIDAAWKKPILKILNELVSPASSKFSIMLGKIVTKFNEQEGEITSKEKEDAKEAESKKIKDDLAAEQDQYKKDYADNAKKAGERSKNNDEIEDLAAYSVAVKNRIPFKKRKYGIAATDTL